MTPKEAALVLELRAATQLGKQAVTIDRRVWVRQPSGWAPQYGWAGDRVYRWDDLGIEPERS